MKIVFFGTPQAVVPVLENLIKHYDVVAVVTAPDQKAGRKQLLTPPPVKIFAEQHHIPVLQPKKLTDSTSHLSLPCLPAGKITSHLFVVAAYGKLIPNEILKLPRFGALNIHPSLLPKYRGSTPIQTTLLNEDERSGVTIIKMDEQMDHGPILHQIPFTLEKTDTFDWLMQSMFAQAAIILPHVIDEYVAGKLKPQSQDDTQATYTKIITKQDGYIDLSYLEKHTSLEIENWKVEIARKVRAYYPWPTVWTKVPVTPHDVIAKSSAKPNNEAISSKIIKFLPSSSHPELDSGSHIIFQMEGKKPVSLKDFLNGYPELRETLEKIFAE